MKPINSKQKIKKLNRNQKESDEKVKHSTDLHTRGNLLLTSIST